MKLRDLLSAGIVVSIASALVMVDSQSAQACNHSWLSRQDPTCSGGILNPGGGSSNGGSSNGGSSVGGDMTPREVRTSRDLMSRGFTCIEIDEYPHYTCLTPGGMSTSEFRVRNESIDSRYLAPSRTWSWDCLRGGGQLWGSSGRLQCEPGLR